MKFDVVVGNPPFQPPVKNSGGSGTRNKIWHKFVELSYSCLQEDGWVAFVTPCGWRTGNFTRAQHRHAQDLIFSREIVSWGAANTYFKIGVGVDWWISGPGDPVGDLAHEHRLLPSAPSRMQIEIINSWLEATQGDCYEMNIKSNDHRRFNRTRGPAPTTSDCVWKHAVTGAQTRDGIFYWYDAKTVGFDQPKVIIHNSSGPAAFYDTRGEIGCGSHAHGYTVSSDAEAQEIMAFFESSLCDWLTEQISTRRGFALPYQIFKRIPKSWRDLDALFNEE